MHSIDNKRFISFEGIDFCGKSTQINLLFEKLAEQNIEPVLIREPGGTDISEKIRSLLLDPTNNEMSDRCELLLYEAARAQLVVQKIMPLLSGGHYLIADRFFDSSTAYQGAGRGLDYKMVREMNMFATSGLKPYKTFFIDIQPETARERQIQNNHGLDRLESGGLDFFKKIRDGYLQLCQDEPQRFIQITGEASIAGISAEIWQTVQKIWQI